MFKYDRLFITMKEKGISTYKIREECVLDSKTIRRLKANENIEMKTLDKILFPIKPMAIFFFGYFLFSKRK